VIRAASSRPNARRLIEGFTKHLGSERKVPGTFLVLWRAPGWWWRGGGKRQVEEQGDCSGVLSSSEFEGRVPNHALEYSRQQFQARSVSDPGRGVLW